MTDFELVPVIDVMDGVAVRAKQGDREHYQPIDTPLAASSDPVAVAEGLLAASGARRLYVADLDAILRRGSNDACIRRIARRLPQTELWVDAGLADLAACHRWLETRAETLVVGSECLETAHILRALADDCRGRWVLSLDFAADGFRGPAEALTSPELWPQRVIVMTLQRVGSGAGPDLERFCSARAAAGERRVYAAGGVRDMSDVTRLRARGAAGALIASALHDGRLTRRDIAALERERRCPPAETSARRD